MKITFLYILFFISLGLSAQTPDCIELLEGKFIPDGKDYKVELIDKDIIDIHYTFFAENTYRVAACVEKGDETVSILLIDNNRNILFDTQEYGEKVFWDFSFDNTVDCVVRIKTLRPSYNGIINILIGFKK